MLAKLHSFFEYRSVFSTHSDVGKFRTIRNNPGKFTSPQKISMTESGDVPLLVRPGTMDAITLWDAFHFQHHMPPYPIDCEGCIVSLGANVGYVTAHLGHKFPKARIIAVEMGHENAQVARLNTQHLGDRCTIVEAAVHTSDDETVFYGGDDVHDLTIVAERTKAGQTRSVKTVSIRGLMDKFGLEEIDFLKMDIEGAEKAIFEANLDWLASVKAINIEVHTPPASVEDCWNHLEQAGFKCVKTTIEPQVSIFGIRA